MGKMVPASRALKSRFITRRIKYNGTQIKSGWAHKNFSLSGDSIVAFIGKCDIPFKYMVDLEDLRKRSRIYSPFMLHFIIEYFDMNLEKTVLRQRLLAVIIKELLELKTSKHITRRGDDLFDGKAKLSISIATTTSISTKIHFGINILTQCTPVKTKGLKDYRISPKTFGLEVIKRYTAEMNKVNRVRFKVRSVE